MGGEGGAAHYMGGVSTELGYIGGRGATPTMGNPVIVGYHSEASFEISRPA